jgi:hypothetical protein
MAESRNARAHSLNMDTFDGVSELGNSSDIASYANQAR